jgi:hypothetical protein
MYSEKDLKECGFKNFCELQIAALEIEKPKLMARNSIKPGSTNLERRNVKQEKVPQIEVNYLKLR